MSRAPLSYGRPPRAAADWRGPSFDPDLPVAGYYQTRLRKGAPPSAVRIWHGPSLDPDTGEEMLERSPLWQCALNGVRVELERFWPDCAQSPISQETHDRIVEQNLTLDPDSPFYDPSRPIDIDRAPPPF